ncbi:MAG: FumA C-terminus/TtdB family hydratase beta subunit [Oscillospiraceae bacterium]
MATIKINSETLKENVLRLIAYDKVLLTGFIYTARDAAHKRIINVLDEGGILPFELYGATIYYAGPTQAPKGLPIGSCGPTTSSRMDIFTPKLLDNGLCCMIGKGERSDEVVKSIVKNKAVYLCAIGGAGALACKCIKSCEVLAYEDLGCESIKRLYVEDFPLIVAIDSHGNNIFDKQD